MSGLSKAISIAGSQKALAKSIGLGQTAVANWIKRGGLVPIEYCAPIEMAFSGAITRQELRPEDWGTHWPELAQAATPALADIRSPVLDLDRAMSEAAKVGLIERRSATRCAVDRERLAAAGQGV